MPLPGNRYSWAALWLIATLLLAAMSLRQWQHGVPLDADLFSLLPATEQDEIVQRAQQLAESGMSRTVLLWVAPAATEQLQQTVKRVRDALAQSKLFDAIHSGLPPPDKTLEALLPWRFVLLSAQDRHLLQQPDGAAAFIEDFQQRLLSPVSATGPVSLQDDPLGLLNRWLQSLPLTMPPVDAATGLWTAKIDDRVGAFLILVNHDDAFSLQAPEQMAALIGSVQQQEAANGTRILATGAALFSAAAARQAKHEISTVGMGSALAATGLLLWIFRSPRALLSLLPVVFGSWVAMIVCSMAFERVHLMTLVFGASLTGVSIDYALHVMADAFKAQGHWSSDNAVRKLLPGLALGMLTSVLAYGCLALAPFPGLQQVALFSGTSLLSAFMMVVLTFPLCLSGFQRQHTPRLLVWLRRWLAWQPRLVHRRWLMSLIVAVLVLAGVTRLGANDDVRLLYSTDEGLRLEDAQLREAFGQRHNSQFLLLEAADEGQLLAREQQVTARLDRLVADGKLQAYSALSQWLPAPSQQHEDRTLLKRTLLSPESSGYQSLLAMGMAASALDQQWQALLSQDDPHLTIEQALSTSVMAPWKSLWVGPTQSSPDQHGVASRIALQGAGDIATIHAAINDLPDVRVVDRIADISELLGRYRTYSAWLVALALAVTWALLLPRYGVRRAFHVVLVPLLAIAATIGLYGWCGLNFNLFSLFGFLLVLGMGVDYAIYFIEAQDHLDNTSLGITLDALTTLFSFGLLSTSATPAVSAFGFSVLCGISFSWLFVHVLGNPLKTVTSPPLNKE